MTKFPAVTFKESNPGTHLFFLICTAVLLLISTSSWSQADPVAVAKMIRASDGTFSNRVEVSWSPVDGVKVYRVFRCLTNGQTCGEPIGFPRGNRFNDTRGTPGTVYYYRVKTCIKNSCGNFSVANTGFKALPLDRPTAITASDGIHNESIELSWKPVKDSVVYRVFRCSSTGQTCGLPVGFSKSTVFSDTQADIGKLYYYRIKACSNTFCSKFSVANAGFKGALPDTLDFSAVTVFMNVNLLEMPSGNTLKNQMVVIDNGVISHVSPANTNFIPDGAMVIGGRSRYLLPGMVDTHTHLGTNVREYLGLNASPALVEISARNQLILYLARGVTTILNNGDFGEPLPRWSEEVNDGTLIGPTIYAAQYARGGSATSDGGPANRSIHNASQARAYTRESFADGYQFMKIYNQTPRDGALAVLDEAHSLGMPVLGHFPQTMTTKETLDNGLDMVAHSGAYLWRFFGNNTNSSNTRIAEAVQMTINNATSVTATVGIEELVEQIWCNDTAGINAYWARPETRYMHFTTVSLNNRGINARWRWNPGGCFRGGYVRVRDFIRKFTLALHQGGVPVMMGTDSPTVLGVPGFSAADEVQALVRSGISLPDAMRIATWNGAEFISRELALEVPFGAIRAGWRADLLLLDSDALENPDNIEDIAGVMADGRWYSNDWFNTQLEEIARSYGN